MKAFWDHQRSTRLSVKTRHRTVTKKRAKNAMRISIAAIVVTIVLQVIQWKCNMPH